MCFIYTIVMSGRVRKMGIEEALKQVKESRSDQSEAFREQLKRYEAFKELMDDAGVVSNKQKFSIPLIERIGSNQFWK